MIVHKLITIITFVAYCQAHCIPCPKEGITISSFTDCDCPLSTFHNEATKTCVRYIECPLPHFRNPLPEIEALAPFLHEIISNTLDSIKPNLNVPKDVTLTIEALKKRFQDLKRILPGLVVPIIGSVSVNNNQLLEGCNGKITCAMREAFKRENNYDLIVPKLKSVFFEIGRNFQKIFDDLKTMAEESCDEGDQCPLIKGLIHLKEMAPVGLDELFDIQEIGEQINKYLIKDVKKHLH